MQPLLPWKSNKYYVLWVCVCSLRYTACNAHVSYCHLGRFRPYNIFLHYLRNGTIFGKKVVEHEMCVLIFSTAFVWNMSHSKKNWARYDRMCIFVFMWCNRYSCQILMKLEFSRQTVEKYIIVIIKHQGLDPLIRSVSRVTTALSNVSSVFQLFSFFVVCSDMISKGFGLVAFFACVKTSSVCIHPSCLVCIQSVVHGVRSRLLCGHEGCSLPEVSITSFLPLQFFVSERLSESSFLTHIQV